MDRKIRTKKYFYTGSNLIYNDEILNIHNDIVIEKLFEGIKHVKQFNTKSEPRNCVAQRLK